MNVDVLSSFLPPILIRRCNQRQGKLTEPFRADFHGAVLFADISGFTSLAENLSQKGIAGGEELTRILNGYFAQLIRMISDHGGEIVKFAGDALLALWTANDESVGVSDAASRAVACGISIQNDLGSFQATPEIRLLLRIGIGAGELAELYLGGVFGRWEFLFTGTPIAQMGIACANGKPGEVMVSSEVWKRISGGFLGEVREAGNVRITHLAKPIHLMGISKTQAEAEAIDILQAYIPAAIRFRLQAGQSGWIGELRMITILFVNLPDLKFDTPLELSQKVMKALQESLYRFEGSINKLSIDEKGVTLVAALGLPPLSHEDDAARGVLAGMTIRESLEKLQVRCSVGISRGRVFCGVIGCDARREYTVIGDTVNLSARLMQAAKGGILCDTATSHEARAGIRFTALPPIHLKGKSSDVPVFRPETKILASNQEEVRSTIIGRHPERKLFEELLWNIRQGKDDLLVFEGESGIGKTTLLGEFRQMAASQRIPAFSGRGDSLGRNIPLLAWRHIFAAFLGFEQEFPPPEELRNVISTTFGERVPEFSRFKPLLNDFLPAEFPDTPQAAELMGEGRAGRLRELLVEMLSTCFPRPMVLTFDDGHWMDVSSWTLIRRVARAIPQILIVVFMRPAGQIERFEVPEVLKHPETRQSGLPTLSLEETRQLIVSRLSIDSFPSDALKMVYEQTDGNPFFIEESLLALRESGFIRVADGACQLAPELIRLAKIPFSGTLEGIISGRIDRLSPQKQLALKVASVFGYSFPFDAVRDVHPIPQDRPSLQEYYSQLTREEMLREEMPPPNQRFIFRQMMIREVTYNLMLFAQRRSLHESIACWLESREEKDPLLHFPLLAHHWEMAGSPEKAAVALEKAGNKAFWKGAFAESLEYFRRLLDLVEEKKISPPPLQLAEWHFRSGMTLYSTGEISGCARYFLQALTVLEIPIPETIDDFRRQFAVELASHIGSRIFPPMWHIKPAPEDKARRLTLAAGCHEMLSSVHQFNNERERAGYHVLRFLKCAESAGERGIPLQGLANGIMSLMTGVNGGALLGDVYANRSRRLLARHSDREHASTTNLVLGMYELGMGRLAIASDHFLKTMEIARQIGLVRALGDGCLFQAITLLFRGENASSEKLAGELEHSGRCAHDFHSVGYAFLIRAIIALRQGNPREAIRFLDELENSGISFTELQGKSSSHGVRVTAHWLIGEKEISRKYARELSSWLSGTVSISVMMVFGLSSLAEHAIWSYEEHPSSEKKQAVYSALFQLKSFARSFQIARPRLYLLRGQAARLFNRPQDAEKEWKKALWESRKRGMPIEAALAKAQVLLRHS
jgi:class 3 adenylate cyclase/tetratricopeptide (TPR) repeat protein